MTLQIKFHIFWKEKLTTSESIILGERDDVYLALAENEESEAKSQYWKSLQISQRDGYYLGIIASAY